MRIICVLPLFALSTTTIYNVYNQILKGGVLDGEDPEGVFICLTHLFIDAKKSKRKRYDRTNKGSNMVGSWHRHGTMNLGQVEFFLSQASFDTRNLIFGFLGQSLPTSLSLFSLHNGYSSFTFSYQVYKIKKKLTKNSIFVMIKVLAMIIGKSIQKSIMKRVSMDCTIVIHCLLQPLVQLHMIIRKETE